MDGDDDGQRGTGGSRPGVEAARGGPARGAPGHPDGPAGHGDGRRSAMRFALRGVLDGREVAAWWDGTGPAGDAHLLARARALVDGGAQFEVGDDPDVRRVRASLAEPAAAFVTLLRSLDAVAGADLDVVADADAHRADGRQRAAGRGDGHDGGDGTDSTDGTDGHGGAGATATAPPADATTEA